MEELMNILTNLRPDIDFSTADKLIEDEILDSFDIVTIISAINTEYDGAIPAEEIIPENFNSAEALYDLIERLQDED